MKSKTSKSKIKIVKSANVVFIEGVGDHVHEDKLNDILAAVLNFIPCNVSIVDEALMMFSCNPNSWQPFHENHDNWADLSEARKMDRTINFVVAMKNYERRTA